MTQRSFHEELKNIIDEYVHGVFRVAKKFPKEELFSTTSQLKRSALSVALNHIEGFARFRKTVYKNFIETSYGSLKESSYLLDFSLKEGWMKQPEYEELKKQAERIGAMLWGILRNLE